MLIWSIVLGNQRALFAWPYNETWDEMRTVSSNEDEL